MCLHWPSVSRFVNRKTINIVYHRCCIRDATLSEIHVGANATSILWDTRTKTLKYIYYNRNREHQKCD